MKKFFMFIVVVMACIINANAQLNVTSVIKDKPQKIMTLQMAYSSFNKDSVLGYYIIMQTSNRFDKSTLLCLGEDDESAIQTLNDLKNLIEEGIASVEITQGNEKITLMYRNELGVKQLILKSNKNAGQSWLTLNQIEKMITWFNNKENTTE